MSAKGNGIAKNKIKGVNLAKLGGSRKLSIYVADDVQVDVTVVENVVELLENDNTVPFIARYRRDRTGNLAVEKIREIQESLTQVKRVEARKESVVKAIDDKLTPEIESSLKCARTLPDVEEIYAPFKKGSKVTFANRARQIGLDEAVEIIQSNHCVNNLNKFVKPGEKGLSNIREVSLGVQHILADSMSKDKDVSNMLNGIFESSYNVTLDTKLSKNGIGDNKYKDYHEKSMPIHWLKAHQVLAINRAEQSKVIHVKLNCPTAVQNRFLNAARGRCISPHSSDFVRNLMNSTLDDCLNRLMLPKIIRRKRAELTRKAEQESAQIFSRNLRRLLLIPPVQGRTILAIDPGFSHGCKIAVVNHNGIILDTGVIYPFGSVRETRVAENKLQGLLTTHNCCTIALGNGHGSRETELFITKMKEAGKLKKELVYSIVNEDGASIYSVSKEAEIEMPKLDVNIRSAVSIARRLQNPLLELIKIEPRHLGVGMYQHDIPDNILKTALSGVLEDCVSLVGVDLNVSGVHALRRIAGLNERKAQEIVEWRKRNGPFSNRRQLKEVRGIGEKSFEQCAGFVRILGPRVIGTIVIDSEDDTAGPVSGKRKAEDSLVGNNKKRKHENSLGFNRLDSTSIHPESYPIAERLLSLTGVNVRDIGTPRMKTEIDNLLKTQDISSLCQTLHSDTATVRFIVNGLCQLSGYDIREDFAKRQFRHGMLSINDIKPNVKLTGRIKNVTTFGAFVDIGVETNGLIHVSKMLPGAFKVLGVGDIVEVIVEEVNVSDGKIGLRMSSIAENNVELM